MKKQTLSRRAARWVVNGIFILGTLGFAASVLGGCEFVRGVRDEGFRQGPALLSDATPLISEKLSDRLGSEVGKAIKDAFNNLPAPPPPQSGDNGLLYGAGTLAALLISNAIRGGIRQYQERKNGGSE